ncbi:MULTISPECIES: glycoside hydrolase family 6 protein [Actinoplanes]|uniref:glycoside hydrolase family 6 protein n=1 Tax=Actinoplanes TaxID=1865 RepID=UPI0005F2786B|nr:MULTISPECIES: glycoside hydrolase family 6 protein [Actinoplanes]GLY01070.1 glucanase [Actinoplanes sp. NBRC 101535]
MGRHLRPVSRRRRALLIATALSLATGAVVLIKDREPAPVVRVPETGSTGGPGLYVDPAGAAAREVRALEQAGRRAEAAVLRRIADRPVATWFTDAAPGFTDRARRLVSAATAAGRLPVLTLYFIPRRDCGSYSAGGASSAAAYKKWVFALREAMRGHRALVVLEPDAVAQTVRGCLGTHARTERYALLAWAVDTLRALPGVAVYLDAGNPSWVPAARMAPALRASGATRARGVSLNVANFETTHDNLVYGTELSRLLDDRHFVVDTSRNGNGPAQQGAGDRHWCNPPGRRLGPAPTLRTGHPLADAYLWVKRPGESDGACGSGAPKAGHWFPAYAMALAR